ncbi:MAG: hypothetical protein KC496_13585 [Anaerolineae bacterium]|nr:hypothetical protein [Anaerolineae bacterium]
MIFQHTLAQVLQQQKTQTRRIIHPHETAIRGKYNRIESVLSNDRVKWQVGKTYAVQPGRGKSQVARICIEKINSEQITRISTKDAIAEGFESRHAFLETWQAIHGADAMNVRVWVLTFRVVGFYTDLQQFTYDYKEPVAYAAGRSHHSWQGLPRTS